jgi:hypothetical protein
MAKSRRRVREFAASVAVAGILLAACGATPAANGIVSGSLRVLAGPVVANSGKGYLSSGRLVLSGANLATVTVKIDSSGRFFEKLPAGTYKIVAGTAALNYQGCLPKSGDVVKIRADRISLLDVVCSVR